MFTRHSTSLEQALGHEFAQRTLLERALTHTSFAHEEASRLQNGGDKDKEEVQHNEQLEFLGDAVLGLVVSEELFRRFPDFHEGQLSKLRAHVVSEKYLVTVARVMKLGAHLKLGHGEEKSGGRAKPTLLVDALEALIGAAYLDGGMADMRRFIVETILEPELERLRETDDPLPMSDFKSALQETAHAGGRPSPDYVVIKEEGPEHKKTFTVEVRVMPPGLDATRPKGDADFSARAQGSTKKKAEQAAAQLALELMQGNGNGVEGGARHEARNGGFTE